MNNAPFKAVIFDMDGVITDSMPYHFRAWRKIFADNGLRVSKYDVYSREGQKGTESIQEIFAKAGIRISAAHAARIITDKEVLLKKIFRQRFIRGARSLLKALKRAGSRLALVTGTSRDEVERILPPAVLTMFEVTVTGSDVKHGKPHPEPYLKALKALKVGREEAVVIENAPFGIMSARAAGIHCFAVTTSLPVKYLKGADRVFKGHRELQRFMLGKSL